MPNNVERISSLSTSLSQSSSRGQPVSVEPRDTPPPAKHHADDYRLVIERDEGTGSYIYKTLDRSTGEVINQFPREEVLKLRDDPVYQAGQVIVTKA